MCIINLRKGEKSMFEVEIKFRVKNKEEINDRFEKLNAKFVELHQCDSIFVKEGIKDFNIPAGENVLRIRKQDGVNYITLKQRLNHLEYETIVEDENVVSNIFLALGYHKLVQVDKFRKETHINGFNITIDEVDKLGCFVEIEKLTEDSEKIEEIKNDILEFAKVLGLCKEDIETKKYDTMMLELNQAQK